MIAVSKSRDLCRRLKQSLSEYVEYVGQRKKNMNAMSLIDPRLEVEKMKATDLLTKALVERLHQPLTEQGMYLTLLHGESRTGS